jgi:hypothetical protein
MGAFASTIFYPISGALIAAYGWPQALVFLAGVQILFCFPLHAVVLRRHPEDHGLNPDGAHAAGASDPASGATFRAAIRSGPFILITTALGLSFFASTVVLVEHVAYLIARGWDPSLAATLVGLFGIAYLPGRALTAYAAGKVSLSTQLAIAFGAEALGVVLLALSSGFISVFAYVVVFGAAYGAIAPLRGAIVAEHFGRRSYGAIIAAQGLIIGIASALGPIVAGGLIDRAGYGLALGACALVFAGAAVAIMFPALRALRVRDRESRRLQSSPAPRRQRCRPRFRQNGFAVDSGSRRERRGPHAESARRCRGTDDCARASSPSQSAIAGANPRRRHHRRRERAPGLGYFRDETSHPEWRRDAVPSKHRTRHVRSRS